MVRRVLACCLASTASLAVAVATIVACGGDAFTLASSVDSGGTTPLPDAHVDAGGGVSGDAGGNADAGGPFCASSGMHLFCEDFDQNGVPGKFVTIPPDSGGANSPPRVIADMTTFLSAPESALAQTPALLKAGDQSAAVLATTVVGASGTRLRLQASFTIGANCVAPTADGSTSGADGVTLILMGTGSYALAVVAQPSAAQLVELVGGADGGLANGIAHEFSALALEPRWVTLTVDLNLSMHTVTVFVGNAAALQNLPLTFPPAFTSASSAAFELGPQVRDVNGISPGCRVRVDNVLFDIL